ncbi:hypothetical protein PoB_005050200 [Plakobranchus ocellatus]|uniref:Apple domain-containing protein n=1 Tax=Plakobranchus ocellatus TaxID=259542 RepID=A0AAV4BXD8_9GAST|nr:hypothetical protein PoB_005050200 [Plakobranchus ocellatus]
MRSFHLLRKLPLFSLVYADYFLLTPDIPTSTGTLTIGSLSRVSRAAGSTGVGFRGNLACLAVVDGHLDRNVAYTSLQNECMVSDSLCLSENTGVCGVTQAITERKFKKAANDSSPLLQNFLECHTVPSLLACSQWCRSQTICRSYTYHSTSPALQCCLYDYVTSAGLAADVGSVYFAVSHP